MPERRTTSSPEPWRQFEARTTFLRVPSEDWPAVRIGAKTEFRASGRAVTQLWNVTCPMLVVGYRVRRGQHDSRLLVLEETHTEPLGAISPESIAREGFESLADFRRYWMGRTKQRFKPLTQVQVYRVRLAQREDVATLGLKLIERLYQEHLA